MQAAQFGRAQGGQGQRAPAKIFALQQGDTTSVDTIAGTLRILLHSAYVLFDTDASFSCISEAFVTVCDLFVENML